MGSDERIDLNKYQKWLFRLALRLCGRPADAEDLVQDVFMKFLKRFESSPPPEGDERIMAWLNTATRNAFRDNLRKLAVRRGVQDDPTLPTYVAPEEDPQPPSLGVTEEELQQALDSLSEKLRSVLVLSQQGMSHAEIAGEVGIRVGAVGKRLHDARKRLRKKLDEIIAARKRGLH
jgi:RNA polymerase sigma-70 factor (ECF subfamily)